LFHVLASHGAFPHVPPYRYEYVLPSIVAPQ
jgi:hypothetical protein